MQIKSIAEFEHPEMRSAFIKLPFVIQIFLFCLFFIGRLRKVLLYLYFQHAVKISRVTATISPI